jgi:hypothetical protein
MVDCHGNVRYVSATTLRSPRNAGFWLPECYAAER